MAIKVFIKRRCPKEKEKELFAQIRKIRGQVPLQPGYISGEYLKAIDGSREFLAISSWFSLEAWQEWFQSAERQKIENDINAIEGVETEYAIYRNIKTR